MSDKFVEYVSRRVLPGDRSYDRSHVRIKFQKRKKRSKQEQEEIMVIVRIGSDLAHQVDIKPGDKVSFLYDEENKKRWFIKKTKDLGGYTMAGSPSAASFFMQFILDENRLFIPEETQYYRYFHSEIHEGGVLIDVSTRLMISDKSYWRSK